jgi:hypothetical protein
MGSDLKVLPVSHILTIDDKVELSDLCLIIHNVVSHFIIQLYPISIRISFIWDNVTGLIFDIDLNSNICEVCHEMNVHVSR